VKNQKFTYKILVLESGQWKDYTEMPTPRCQVTTIRMLIVMGGCGDKVLSTTELFVVKLGNTLYVLSGHAKTVHHSPTAVYTAPLDTLSSHQLKWQRLVETPCDNPATVGLNNKYLLAIDGNDIYTLNSTATACNSSKMDHKHSSCV